MQKIYSVFIANQFPWSLFLLFFDDIIVVVFIVLKLNDPIKRREQDLMNELEQQHIKKAAILTEQNLLPNFSQACENTVQGVLSTIHSSDNANLLSIRSAIESTLAAATENQYLALESKAHFLPEYTRLDQRRLQRVVDVLSKLDWVSKNPTCAESATAAGSDVERVNLGEAQGASFTITTRDA